MYKFLASLKASQTKKSSVATGPLSTAAGAPLGVPLHSHRPTEAGWNHWRLSNPISCPQQSPQEQVAQCPAQLGFEYLQDQRLLSLSGQVVPVLMSKDFFFFFLCVQKFLVFSFVPVASCPGTGQPWEKSGSVFFITSWLLLSDINRHWLVRSMIFLLPRLKRESSPSGS